MKVLITGAGGMLGTDLSEQLARSFEVCGAGRRPAGHLRIPYVRINFRNQDEVESLITQERPDILFHCAAMTDVDGCECSPHEAYQDNVEATKHLFGSCRKRNIFFIFISTDYVFDGQKQGEYLETDQTSPLSVYGQTKLEAEVFLQSQQSGFVIFRTCWLYGVHGRSFPKVILSKAETVSELEVVGDQIGRPTYTHDVATVFCKLLKRGADLLLRQQGEIFHLANQGICSRADFARAILGVASNERVRVKDILSDEAQRPAARPKNSVLSLAKAKEKLGIHLRDWQASVGEFVPLINRQKRIQK